MINICSRCGLYRADKTIELTASGAKAVAVCPECGFPQPFLRLPLLVLSGASGTGKSAVCGALTGQLPGVVMLDSDILWRPEFNNPERYRDYFETWLRMAKNIGQSGRPVLLVGAGIGVPANLKNCIERRYFSAVHYLALVCDDEILEKRLKARPAWRSAAAPEWVESQISFNHWFREEAPKGTPPVELLDTSTASLPETASRVSVWVTEKLASIIISDSL
jgi:predicted kinase